MGGVKGKTILFSISQFVIMIAWLGSLFAILYFESYYLVAPSIAAFVLLNLALGVWIHKTVRPTRKRSYRRYLAIQTIFLAIWCPLLTLILHGKRFELISIWVAVLLVFYFGVGVVSWGKLTTSAIQSEESVE